MSLFNFASSLLVLYYKRFIFVYLFLLRRAFPLKGHFHISVHRNLLLYGMHFVSFTSKGGTSKSFSLHEERFGIRFLHFQVTLFLSLGN